MLALYALEILLSAHTTTRNRNNRLFMLHMFNLSLKDRQHRSKGGLGFCFIIHEPKGLEQRVTYHMKARFSFH